MDPNSQTPKLFGTSGIRGTTNDEISCSMAMKMSSAFGDQIGNEGTVVVGRDTRFGAQMMVTAISAGLMSRGISVIDCGILPTPALGLALIKHRAKGGVMVTGSHMPPERIGLIYMDSNASYVADSLALELEGRYFNADPEQNKVTMEAIGNLEKDEKATGSYISHILEAVDVALIRRWNAGRKRPLKVLADPGNGTASETLPGLLKRAGCDVVAINNEYNGRPNRPPEPRAHTLASSIQVLKDQGCEVGACTDIDSDRIIFINSLGEPLSEDVVGAIFAKDIFTNKSFWTELDSERPVLVTPVNSSGLVELICQPWNVEVIYCKIGQPDTERVLHELGGRAWFSYEESGKYYFARKVHWADGILATLKLMEIMAKRDMDLKALESEFPKFFQSKSQFKCSEKNKRSIISRIKELWLSEQPIRNGGKREFTLDGFKRIYEDNSWLMLRASGTEPLIRVYSDAMSQDRSGELLKIGEAVVERAIKEMEDS